MTRFTPALMLALAAFHAPAHATTLDEAIAAALRHAPVIAIADAERSAASGRRLQAWGAATPAASASGMIGTGRIDPKNFFGLSAADVTPKVGQISIEQPIFAGGRIVAGIAQANAGIAAAEAGQAATRARLAVEVAEAYGQVLSTRTAQDLAGRLVAQMVEIERQAKLRFTAGEIASTDVAQAQARLAEARGAMARAEGERLASEAHYRNLVGAEPTDLAPLPETLDLPATLDEALAIAAERNPMLAQAMAGTKAARAGSRAAKGELLPMIGAFAEANMVRDQFFPDYRADTSVVGIRARIDLSPGRNLGRIRTASAEAHAAEARLRDARSLVEEQVIAGFHGVRTARLVAEAAEQQASASAQALASVRHEVRVGMKPQLALLDAEREATQAATAAAAARTGRIVAAYRLQALLGLH